MAENGREWTGVTGGRTFGQKAMKILFSLVDVRFCYVILLFVVPFYMVFNHKEYLAIYHYFRKRQDFSIFKSFYKTFVNHFLFGQMMFDRFAMYSGDKKFHVENPDNKIFLDMLSDNRGCIIASAHIGNPELLGYLMKPTKRMNALIYGGETEEIQKNRMDILTRHNIRPIPVEKDLAHIYLINDALSNGEIVSMPCDRTFGSNKSLECKFLNGRADFPIGAFTIAEQFNVPVLCLFALKTSAKKYHIRVIQIPPPTNGNKRERIYEMTRSFVETLESILVQYPEQWFNFYEFWKDDDEHVSRT